MSARRPAVRQACAAGRARKAQLIQVDQEPARAAGHLALARCNYEQAVSIYDRLGHRREAAQARNNLGGVQFRLGEMEAAQETWQQALAVLEVVGDLETAEQVRHNFTVLEEAAAQIESAVEEA